jgi:methylthioribose-1-phosphate isomerase
LGRKVKQGYKKELILNSNFVKAILWKGKSLDLLDQRKLPSQKMYLEHKTLDEVISSIRSMVVRGAPAIAISGIFGFVLYLKSLLQKPSWEDLKIQLRMLLDSRPTAVNLKLAIEAFLENNPREVFEQLDWEEYVRKSEDFAMQLFEEDIQTNTQIANHGADLFGTPRPLKIMTYCNTGSIATAGIGTALGVIRALHSRGFDLEVYVCETRPYHQGSRLTAWELEEEGIPHYLLCDNMAAWLMKDRAIDSVIVGADRIAQNGDTANKIGTYALSILAKYHAVPFYVAGSQTSFDWNMQTGREITIEMRDPKEITQNSFLKNNLGEPIYPPGLLAPKNVKVLNPGFDVTPNENITGIITEKGVIQPVNTKNIMKLFGF